MHALNDVVLAGDDRDQIGGERRGRVEVPGLQGTSRLGPQHATVAADPPCARRGDAHGDAGLQVRLIEARQHLVRVEGLEVRVDVHLAVHRVAQPVQADAGVLVLALRGHRQAVGSGAQASKPEYVAVEPVLRRGQALAVQRAFIDRPRRDVDEGLGALVRGVENDRRRALERGRVGIVAEHQRDLVREVGQQRGASPGVRFGEIVLKGRPVDSCHRASHSLWHRRTT